MKTPVLIPAHNEAEYIGKTLGHIPNSVEPIVITNGESHKTADIARSFGAKTIELAEAGKMIALQAGLRDLGKRALDGFVVNDADTHPIFPNSWASSVSRELSQNKHAVINGPLLWNSEAGLLGQIYRSGRWLARDIKYRRDQGNTHMHGPNMLIKPSDESLDMMLAAPNIWPGEDKAIIDMVKISGGVFSIKLDPKLSVISSARGFPTIPQRIAYGRPWAQQRRQNWWSERPVKDTPSYQEWKSANDELQG